MKSKTELITDLYDCTGLKKAFLKMCGGHEYRAEELRQEVFLILWGKPEEYIQDRVENERLFATAIIIARNILFGKSSPFKKQTTELSRYCVTANSDREPLDVFNTITTNDDIYFTDLHQALIEELPNVHYYPRHLLGQILKRSQFNEQTGKWEHAKVRDVIEPGSSNSKYMYTTKAIKRGKEELKHLIQKSINKKQSNQYFF